ncbi:MAG: hypothetical protein ABIS67_05685 [Candidatus Eisenbacteria bacterium]
MAGTPIWFESADAELAPSPEAFAGLLLLPALQQQAKVVVDSRLDPVWLDGTAKLPAIYNGWWGYTGAWPYEYAGSSPPAETRAAGAAACFTGGVDSFYTLLSGGERFDTLVHVHGYDIPLEDHARIQSFERSFREVAARTGKLAILLRTNLREHPIFASVNWERTHGAALAAAGLILSPRIQSLVVPSSYRYLHLRPWGSHPETDPLWSTSRTSIVHDDATFSREEKTRRIVDEPMVWEHLRVCWENRVPTGNCSACHKCVRTMAAIAAYGRLAEFTVFDRTTPLAARLDALPPLPEHLIAPWGNLLELDLAPPDRGALDRLLERSRPGARPGMMRRLVRFGMRMRRRPRSG